MAGITFRYTDHGSEGLCKADGLLFITSRGADFADGPHEACEMGERYLRAVCGMCGIDEVTCLAADGLDEYFTKTDAIVADAVRRAGELAAGWPLPAEVQGVLGNRQNERLAKAGLFILSVGINLIFR